MLGVNLKFLTWSFVVLSVNLTLNACKTRNSIGSSQIKVIGGHTVETPGYMASLVSMNGSTIFCGGTFIASDVVVTAAHCVIDHEQPFGVIPALKVNEKLGDARRIAVRHTTLHSQWYANSPNHDYDIALLFLQPYQVSEFRTITPIELNQANDFPQLDTTLSVLGFGLTSKEFNAEQSRTLQSVDVNPIPNEICAKQNGYANKVNARQLCAGDLIHGGKDACFGDSGGPLVADNGSGLKLVGVTSWGRNCGAPKNPGIYTRISSFAGWINAMRPFIEKSYPKPDLTITIKNYRPNADRSNFGELRIDNFTNVTGQYH